MEFHRYLLRFSHIIYIYIADIICYVLKYASRDNGARIKSLRVPLRSYIIARYNSCGDLSVEDITLLSLDAYFKFNPEFFQSLRYDAGEAGD